jgi:hypothetical protein
MSDILAPAVAHLELTVKAAGQKVRATFNERGLSTGVLWGVIAFDGRGLTFSTNGTTRDMVRIMKRFVERFEQGQQSVGDGT